MKKVTLKMIIVGDGGVGKTTLLHRYVKGEFIDTTTMTIGVEFLVKNIEVESILCQLTIWDISGQDRFRFMVDKYIKGASGALLLYDITNLKSFINVEKWVQILKKYYENLPILLIAAKCDLEDYSMVGDLYAEKTQKRFNMIGYIKTSSKTGLNVDYTFENLTKYAVKTQKF